MKQVLGIVYSADVGLSGLVPDPLRAFSFSFDEIARLITIRAEVDKELIVEDDDWEDLSCASSDVSADLLLGEGTQVEMDIVVVPCDQPLDPLPDGIVFLRAGEQAPEGYGGVMPLAESMARLKPHFPRQ